MKKWLYHGKIFFYLLRLKMFYFQIFDFPSLLKQSVIKWSESHSVMSDCLQPHGLHSPWNSSHQNTGVGSLSLLQGIFPTQEFYQGLLHCRQILYQLSSQGSPWTINVMMSWWTLKPHIYSYKTIVCVCVLVTQLCPTFVTQ